MDKRESEIEDLVKMIDGKMNKVRFAIILVLLSFLVACTAKKTNDIQDALIENEQEMTNEQYLLECWELSAPEKTVDDLNLDNNKIMDMETYLDGSSVWRIARLIDPDEYCVGFLIQWAVAPYQEWKSAVIYAEVLANELKLIPIRFSDPQDGKVYLFYESALGENGEKYGYGEWSFENGLENKNSIADSSIDYEKIMMHHWKSEKDGSFYYEQGSIVYVFSPDFSSKNEIRLDGSVTRVFQNAKTSELMWSGSLKNVPGIYRVKDSEKILTTEDIPENFGVAIGCFVGDDHYYFTDGNSIWSYMQGRNEKVCDMFQQGFYCDHLMDFQADENANPIFLTRKDSKEYIWCAAVKQNATESAEKKQITFAAVHIDPWLKEMITQYNRNHEEIEIVLRVKDDKTAWDDYQRRLLTEILAKEGPDIILNCFEHEAIQNLLQKGVLADLSDVCDKKDEYWDGIFEDNGEPLYEVPLNVQPQTLIVKKSIAEKMQSYTPQELMRVVSESNAVQFGAGFYSDGMSGSDIVNLLAFTGQADQRIIDFERKTCDLESDYFMSILEFAKKYQASEKCEPKAERFINDEIVVQNEIIISPFDMNWAKALMGGEAVCIGYPTPTGNFFSYGSEDVIVNAASDNLEEIKDFIRFLLSYESQTRLAQMNLEISTVSSFPVRKESAEEMFNSLLEWENKTNSLGEREGVHYQDDALSAEEVENLRYVLNHLSREEDELDNVREMAEEELQGYFRGDKSVKEVVSILQNRISLYINE